MIYLFIYLFLFFYKHGEWIGIKRHHQHPNKVGTPGYLHLMPPNLENFY